MLIILSVRLPIRSREVVLATDESEVVLDVDFTVGDTIEGQVVDDEGRPIERATVKATMRHVESMPASSWTTEHLPARPALTDQGGKFEFDALYEGSYTFEITAAGFEPLILNAISAGTIDLKIVLKKK